MWNFYRYWFPLFNCGRTPVIKVENQDGPGYSREETKFLDANEIYAVPEEEAHIFLLSSLALMIPAYRAYTYKAYAYMMLSIVTSGVSVLYWYKPTYGWRRNLDLVFAKMSFSVYFLTAYLNLHRGDHIHSMAVYGGTPIMLALYGMSVMNVQPWWLYHFAFHMSVIGQKWLTLELLLDESR